MSYTKMSAEERSDLAKELALELGSVAACVKFAADNPRYAPVIHAQIPDDHRLLLDCFTASGAVLQPARG